MLNKNGFILIEALFVFLVSIMCVLILYTSVEIIYRIEMGDRYNEEAINK